MTDEPISRQAAIDIVSVYAKQLNDYIGTPNDSEIYAFARGLILSIERNMRAVPSVQPEIIHCCECKHWDKSWTNDWAKDYHYCPMIDGVRKVDFYCADAERRTDE